MKFDEKNNPQNRNLQKTSNFQIKQAPKQASHKSSKIPTTPHKIKLNSQESCKVGYTELYPCTISRFTPEAFSKAGCGRKAVEV